MYKYFILQTSEESQKRKGERETAERESGAGRWVNHGRTRMSTETNAAKQEVELGWRLGWAVTERARRDAAGELASRGLVGGCLKTR